METPIINRDVSHPSPIEGFNPLIDNDEAETLKNVHDALSTLQELSIAPLGGELYLNQASASGLYLLLAATKGALAYVIQQRE